MVTPSAVSNRHNQPQWPSVGQGGKIHTVGSPRAPKTLRVVSPVLRAPTSGQGAASHPLTSQHLHQDLPEGVSLAAMEALALVEASVVGLKIPQRDGECAPQGIVRDGSAPVAPLQEGQQPRGVGADHMLAQAFFTQLAAPGFASPPVLQGVVGAGDPQGSAHRALEHRGVVCSGQLWGQDIHALYQVFIEHILCSLNRRDRNRALKEHRSVHKLGEGGTAQVCVYRK